MHRYVAAPNRYAGAIGYSRKLFEEVQQRISAIGVKSGGTCGAHIIDIFLAGKKAQQNFLVGYP
jgi:hypothetical protein